MEDAACGAELRRPLERRLDLSASPNVRMPSVVPSGICAFTTSVISGFSTQGTYVSLFSRYAASRVSGNEMTKKMTMIAP